MKYSMLFFALFFNLMVSNAQIQKLATHQVVGTYQLDLVKDELTLVSQQHSPQTENKLLAVNVDLSNNELIIDYQLAPLAAQGYYIFKLEIEMDNQDIRPNPSYLLGDHGKINLVGSTEKQIIWTNIIPDLPRASGQLQLTLSVESWGRQHLAYGVDCNVYPEFGFKQKIPFYAGLVVGLGGIVTGVVLKGKAEQHLENHKISNAISVQEKEYESYTDNLKKAEIISYISIGIIAIDTLLYFLRKNKHKKRIEVFEEHCKQNALSVQPFWELPTTQMPQQVGLHFSYQF